MRVANSSASVEAGFVGSGAASPEETGCCTPGEIDDSRAVVSETAELLETTSPHASGASPVVCRAL
ncbi:hypothetical protein [Propionimicrobium sp. PCR01-08-3]|uniref:hypothetical protein n=1 Tax=Propionimicrobium sp. PCR01-08-3 TaxID=3052086 RepID=UPI00255C4541|nr:hypothetical protein [Propionimicrobium sp. PCR01-08-3]WIY82979.1 hypothetical protein QQ658_01030 [Propionimicrobium sp. PCR01-08-3]